MSKPMGKGFRIDTIPVEQYPSILLFATGSGGGVLLCEVPLVCIVQPSARQGLAGPACMGPQHSPGCQIHPVSHASHGRGPPLTLPCITPSTQASPPSRRS